MKVVFLDVDGVLNYEHSKSRCEGFIGIDNDKVKRLRQIVEATGARIFLTSSWRMRWERIYKDEQGEIANYLDRKLKRERLVISDKILQRDSYRGEGIYKWLQLHSCVENFVILDDDTFDYEEVGLMKNLVKTNFYGENGGLQDEHVEKAIRILNEQIKRTIDNADRRD